jgi:hypothetical protein
MASRVFASSSTGNAAADPVPTSPRHTKVAAAIKRSSRNPFVFITKPHNGLAQFRRPSSEPRWLVIVPGGNVKTSRCLFHAPTYLSERTTFPATYSPGYISRKLQRARQQVPPATEGIRVTISSPLILLGAPVVVAPFGEPLNRKKHAVLTFLLSVPYLGLHRVHPSALTPVSFC